VAGSTLGRRVLLAVGLALILVAQFSPLADWGEHRSFAAHMAQHLLLGDLAPLALVLATSLSFGRVAAVVALPVWIANLVVWHVPVVYEAALHNGWLHLVQHAALFVAGALLWAAILRDTLLLGARIGVVAGMMLFGLVLSGVFLWWPRVLYPTYAHGGDFAGMSPLTDQRAGGGLMLLEGSIVAVAAAGWLILQLFRTEPVTPAAEGASQSP
jgi:cytochrome c oxidase assembly factor CtaG